MKPTHLFLLLLQVPRALTGMLRLYRRRWPTGPSWRVCCVNDCSTHAKCCWNTNNSQTCTRYSACLSVAWGCTGFQRIAFMTVCFFKPNTRFTGGRITSNTNDGLVASDMWLGQLRPPWHIDCLHSTISHLLESLLKNLLYLLCTNCRISLNSAPFLLMQYITMFWAPSWLWNMDIIFFKNRLNVWTVECWHKRCIIYGVNKLCIYFICYTLQLCALKIPKVFMPILM